MTWRKEKRWFGVSVEWISENIRGLDGYWRIPEDLKGYQGIWGVSKDQGNLGGFRGIEKANLGVELLFFSLK